MTNRSSILLLVGPKGVGKSYLAKRMQRELGLGFVEVEPIWVALAQEIAAGTKTFDAEGQARVLTAVREQLKQQPCVVLESTGTAPWFETQLRNLRALARLELIKVAAPSAVCLDRIRTRDASRHIPVTDERIAEINALAQQVELPWSMVVNNIETKDADAFLEALGQRLTMDR